MPRTAEKVRELVREDPELADVLENLLEREGDIQWRDVKGDISSGQWGRLLQKDVLVEGEEGFELADPEGVREGLHGDQESTGVDAELPDDGGASWSKWDKLAALGAIALFAGYSIGSVRDVVGNLVNIFLGPLDTVLPFYVVIMVLAVITGLYTTILQANLMDMDRMSVYQQQMKDIQERQKEAKERGDEEALEEIREEQMEAMGDQMGMFKEQFRPMVWIMLLTIPVFLWMYWKLLAGNISGAETTLVLPLVGQVGLMEGAIGPIQTWIVWYFLCSMGFSQIIRKALNIQTTPT